MLPAFQISRDHKQVRDAKMIHLNKSPSFCFAEMGYSGWKIILITFQPVNLNAQRMLLVQSLSNWRLTFSIFSFFNCFKYSAKINDHQYFCTWKELCSLCKPLWSTFKKRRKEYKTTVKCYWKVRKDSRDDTWRCVSQNWLWDIRSMRYMHQLCFSSEITSRTDC